MRRTVIWELEVPLLKTSHRLLIWTSFPSSNQEAATVVWGQGALTTGTLHNPGISNRQFWSATHISMDAQRTVVADSLANRVVIFNPHPSSSYAPADVVVGQSNFSGYTANSGAISSSTLNAPYCAFTDGTHLVVCDYSNHRVLIWNSIPTSSGTAADVVLGQPDFVSSTANSGGISAQSLRFPIAADSDGSRLIVSDYGNHRVLVWNTFPSSNQQAADLVLGQPNFTSNTANNGGISGATLSSPYEIWTDGSRLAVADLSNNRVLIWNSFPTVNQQVATMVLGQSTMTSNTANSGGIGLGSMQGPAGVFYDGSRFTVADAVNHRMLIWNGFPSASGQPADSYFGQPDAVSATANNGGISRSVLNLPIKHWVKNSQMWIPDYNNGRISVVPLP